MCWHMDQVDAPHQTGWYRRRIHASVPVQTETGAFFISQEAAFPVKQKCSAGFFLYTNISGGQNHDKNPTQTLFNRRSDAEAVV